MSQLDPGPPRLDRRYAFRGSNLWGGGVLIAIGLYFLLYNLGLLAWLKWDVVWPVVLIGLGAFIILRRWR